MGKLAYHKQWGRKNKHKHQSSKLMNQSNRFTIIMNYSNNDKNTNNHNNNYYCKECDYKKTQAPEPIYCHHPHTSNEYQTQNIIRGRVNCYDYEEPIKPTPEKKEHQYKPHDQTETIIKCGTVAGSAPLSCNSIVMDGVGSNSYGFQPIVQATVALDTSKLINPTVKIDFSSLISIITCYDTNYFLRLTFKLSKVCCGGCIPLGNWTFEQVNNQAVAEAPAVIEDAFVHETGSFNFSWCECGDCPDCCRYIVEIVDQQCYNINLVNVGNISLTAMAVGLKNSFSD